MSTLEKELEGLRDQFASLQKEINKAIVGYEALVQDVLMAIFSRGHVLLEGVPGLGKTYLVKVISKVVGLESGRIQCTPDLMPADILGTQIVQEQGGARSLFFEKGPVFANLVLVDEINRATPKTQAALLEVMQEQVVSAGGKSHEVPKPFFVLATQNPMEMEGTYPLPEAQLDRFMFKVKVPFPSEEELVEISRRTTGAEEVELSALMNSEELMKHQETLQKVPIADELTHFAAKLILATHPEQEEVKWGGEEHRRYVSYGASPRGLQALIRGAKAHAVLCGRLCVAEEDVRAVAKVALRHRVILNFEGEAEQVDVEALLDNILVDAAVPELVS